MQRTNSLNLTILFLMVGIGMPVLMHTGLNAQELPVSSSDELKKSQATFPPAATRKISFSKDIYPLLKQHCLGCHEGSNPESGVRLDYHAKLLGESDGVPLVLRGSSKTSRLIHVVAGLDPDKQMPPPDLGEALSSQEIGILRAWIDQGAKWDETVLPNPHRIIAKKHWAFQPIQRPPVPANKFRVAPSTTENAPLTTTVNSIDSFIAQGHESEQLLASPTADRATLVRRLYLILHGMPPTPQELEQHTAEDRAWSDVVQDVLNSPHYGERMGRHWLDSARWAESEGYAQNNARPHAWRYRDYVTESFNRDVSYARFIKQQIAGDEMEPYSDENLIATGFLAAARISADDLHFYRAENDMYTDIVSTLSRSVLGLTIGCARCHDHKFDPITQRDFYRLKAFFTKGFPGNLVLKDTEHPEAIDQISKDLLAFDLKVRKRVLSTGFEEEPESIRHLLNSRESERTLEQEREFRPHRTRMNIQIAGCNAFRIQEDEQERLDVLRSELDKVINDTAQTWAFYSPITSPHELNTLPMAGNFPLMHDKDRFLDQRDYLLARGQIFETVATVTPGWPEAFGNSPDIDVHDKSRTLLANWITSKQNPLTARVWVNRIWQFHFGTGLVSTPGNFGIQGAQPSHPALLDWLASELIENNWSTKHIHRLITTSQTWKQRIVTYEQGRTPVEPTLLTGWPRRRLEAEAIRDSLLVVSGELDRSIGGISIPVTEETQSTRRGMYLFQERDKPPQLQSLFDGPTALSEACLQRQVSTSPLQSLYLLNNRFAQDRSLALAARIQSTAGEDKHKQIQLAFQLAFGRSPDQQEFETSLKFLNHFDSMEANSTPQQKPTFKDSSNSLTLWLKSDVGVKNAAGETPTNNESVTHWQDQAIGENQPQEILGQEAPALQPQFLSKRLDGMGGLPVIRFRGGDFGEADHVLEAPDHDSLHLTNGFTIGAVVRFRGKGNRNEPIILKARNGGNDIAAVSLLRMASDGKLAISQNINGQWGDRLKTDTAIPDDVPLVILVRWKDELLELKVITADENLAEHTVTLAGQIDSGVGGPISIGGYSQAFSDEGERMNGDIGEVMYFTQGIDDKQFSELEKYLTIRWLNNSSNKMTALELFSQALINLNEFVYIE